MRRKNEALRTIFGILLIIGGIALGIYVGLYLCFVGGIVQIVNAIKSSDVNGYAIAWGIVRIIFASVAGYICCYIPIIAGLALMED